MNEGSSSEAPNRLPGEHFLPSASAQAGTTPARGFRFGLPTLSARPARYGVFFSTYLYQGLVAGFSLTALSNHLAARGISAAEIGLHFALAGLPWTVQPILWGPLVDRAGAARMGRRRIWGVLAVFGCHLALAGLLLVPGAESLGWLGLVFFVHSLFASLLDTTCDRMIMDHVPQGELGRVSAATRAGFVSGTSLGAAAFAWTLSAHGLATSAALLLGLGFVATLPMLLVREAPGDALISLRMERSGSRPLPMRRFLLRTALSMRRKRVLRLLALCFATDAALALFELRFGIDLVQGQGWDAVALSRLQAGLALVSGTLGAVLIGLWSDRSGPLPALRSLLAASAAAFALATLLIGMGAAGAAGPVILGLTGVLPGFLVVALVPALMQASRGRAGAATQFEVFMAAMNLGSVAGGAVSGLLAPVLPLTLVALTVCAVFSACTWLALRTDLIAPRGRSPHHL